MLIIYHFNGNWAEHVKPIGWCLNLEALRVVETSMDSLAFQPSANDFERDRFFDHKI